MCYKYLDGELGLGANQGHDDISMPRQARINPHGNFVLPELRSKSHFHVI
jgi:hypothetical protein